MGAAMGDTIGTILVIIIIIAICAIKNLKSDPEEERQKQIDAEAERVLERYGPISPMYICPHCQTKGHVRTIPVKRKKGVSGAKVTGALLTFGVSMLATGLSRKEGLTQAHCGNCDSTWDF
jgi:hypothetical protein